LKINSEPDPISRAIGSVWSTSSLALYFDTFDQIGDFGILTGLVRVRAWRDVLGQRHSIKSAVTSDYPYLMREFIKRRNSRLSFMMQSLHPLWDMLTE
jgi:hypothetical protein